jgi:TPR repeat protein
MILRLERWTLTGVALAGIAVLLAAGCAASARQPVAAPIAAKPADGCRPDLPEHCEAACFAGDGQGCAIYGMAVEGIADAPVRLKAERTRGRRALEHGCHKLDNLDACWDLYDYDYDYLADAKFQACDGWSRLCERGHLPSCTAIGDCLLYEPGDPKDVERAIALFRSGCEKRNRTSCRELAFMLEAGRFLNADPAGAFGLLKKACELDDPLACAHLGRFYERGIGTKADVAAARPLYRAACARGIKQLPCQALERLGEDPPAIKER